MGRHREDGRPLELALARGRRQAEFTERLLADPPRVRGWVRRLLEDCEQAFFAESWARVRPSSSRTPGTKRDQLDLAACARLGADFVEAILR